MDAVARLIAEREAQGHGRHLSDPAVIARVAQIVKTPGPPACDNRGSSNRGEKHEQHDHR